MGHATLKMTNVLWASQTAFLAKLGKALEKFIGRGYVQKAQRPVEGNRQPLVKVNAAALWDAVILLWRPVFVSSAAE